MVDYLDWARGTLKDAQVFTLHSNVETEADNQNQGIVRPIKMKLNKTKQYFEAKLDELKVRIDKQQSST